MNTDKTEHILKIHKKRIDSVIENISELMGYDKDNIKFECHDYTEDGVYYIRYTTTKGAIFSVYCGEFPGCCGAITIDNMNIYTKNDYYEPIIKSIVPLLLEIYSVDVGIYITASYQRFNKVFADIGYESMDLGKNRNTVSILTAWALKDIK